MSDAIKKATESAKKELQTVAIREHTIPHETYGEFGGGKVLLKPASPGTGIIAGGGVRAVLEAAGVKDVLAKSLGSKNHANVVNATLSPGTDGEAFRHAAPVSLGAVLAHLHLAAITAQYRWHKRFYLLR